MEQSQDNPIILPLNGPELEGIASDKLREYGPTIKSKAQVRRKKFNVGIHKKRAKVRAKYNPLNWSFSEESLKLIEAGDALNQIVGANHSIELQAARQRANDRELAKAKRKAYLAEYRQWKRDNDISTIEPPIFE